MSTYVSPGASGQSEESDNTVGEQAGPPAKATRRRKAAKAAPVDGAPFELGGAFKFAARLAERLRGRYRYAPGLGWRFYNKAYWEEAHEAQLIPELREMLVAYAPDVIREGGREGLSEIGWATTSGIDKILRVVRGLEGIFTKDEDFDAPRTAGRTDMPYLFPCSNGITIELYDDGRWVARDSHPDDLMTQVGCAYDPEARATKTAQLFALYQPDEEIRAYLLRVMAASLRGLQIERMFVWYGPLARNGKGTMQAVFQAVFGGYSHTIPIEALTARNPREYRDELVQLKGKRLVFADEPEEGMRFSASTVTKLTGGSSYSGRGIGRESVVFTPTWSLVVPCNVRPSMPSHSGLENRYSETIWNFHLQEHQIDPTVKESIIADASGVLNVLLKFWTQFCAIGLAVPESVKEQTVEGKLQANREARFVSEVVEQVDSSWVRAGDLYNAYRTWCDDNGERFPLSNVKFAAAMLKLGLVREEHMAGRRYMGVKLVLD